MAPSTNSARGARLCRYVVAFIWIYQGIVPKLLLRSADELAMNIAAGFSAAGAVRMANIAGVAELSLGLLVLLTRWRWPLWLTILLMVVLTLIVTLVKPVYLGSAFNAITLNVATAALAATVLLLSKENS